MFILLLFTATAIIGTYFLASGAMTAALSVSAIYDRIAEKRASGGGSIICESAGILLLILGFVFRVTDPFHAVHAMFIGALLLCLAALLRPARADATRDPVTKRVQVGHYRAALVCLATIAIFHSVAPFIQ